MTTEFENLFIGNDMRTPNGAFEAFELCLNGPEIIAELIEIIKNGTPKHKMCASDALEQISAAKPELLAKFATEIFEIAKTETQKEVRWHVAQIAPRLDLNQSQARDWVENLKKYLNDKSRIVVTFSMTAIWEISQKHNINGAREIVENLGENGAPSVKARARKILE